MTIADAKAALRKSALARRAAVPEATRKAFADRLALEGVAIARRARVRTVSAYWPMREEADVSFLIHALAYHEFVVALPCVVGRGMPLIFRRWTSRDPLVPGPFGTTEPSRRLPEVRPDILFTPLLAFDRQGGRLGFGAGYYDLTLAELRSMKPIIAIGVAFSAQEVEQVPVEAHDQRLDLVLTESELIDCRRD
jgi:5-formyltetrahydrofolate cyclo-ligase